MKNLLIIFGLLLGFTANAYEVPKDAVIKVFDKSGKQIGEMSRSDYKVVKLGTSKVVTKTKIVKQCDSVKDVGRHQSVILHAGPGKNGLKASHNGSAYSVTEQDAAVFGATICTSENGAGICASAHSNETYQLGIKFDFD